MEQFFYTREVEDKTDPENIVKKTYMDHFNPVMMIRSLELEDGRRLVLLNDIHERLERVPQINPKTNKVTGQTKERNTFQSEIYLSKEDNIRFKDRFNKL